MSRWFPVLIAVALGAAAIRKTSLAEGVLFERRVFQSRFSLEDQKEGTTAFIEKRKPAFKHR
jgi:enoyl-CoA hydratase